MDAHPQLSSSDILIDSAQVFLLWTANNFDVAATAFAVGIDAVALQRVVDSEMWVEKVAPIVARIKSLRPGDFEKSCNRALAFVQGTRLRLLCERVISEMTGWSKEELRENVAPDNITKDGRISQKISTRFLGDLASACEKANAICFSALGDTASDRAKRSDSADAGPVLDLHAKISACMAGVAESKTPRNLLLNAQLEVAADIAKHVATPKKFEDDTFVDDAH